MTGTATPPTLANRFESVNAVIPSESPATFRIRISPGCAGWLEVISEPETLVTEVISGRGASIFITIGGMVAPLGEVNCTIAGPTGSPLGTATCNWPFKNPG